MSHTANLERVSDRIGAAITEFCASRVGATFHADELRQHVFEHCGHVAPGSPDRILRDLRQRGVVHYELVSRRLSLYRIPRALETTTEAGGQLAWVTA